MRIVEFQTDVVSLRDVVAYLRSRFTLSQVGGRSRVYQVGNELGVVFLVDNSPKAVGLTWQKGSDAIAHIYLWNALNVDHAPDIYTSVPMGATHEILKAIGDLVERPQRGVIEDQETGVESVPGEVSVPDFIAMAKRMFNSRVENLSADQLTKVATANNVTVPQELLRNPQFRVGTSFNLSGPRPKFLLAKAAPSNVRFSFSAMDRIDPKLEHDFMKENGENATMEQQYDELKDKVSLVAGNKSSYIKALLLTGAPSSGKSYNVIETLKKLGLSEGHDYIVVKGKMTAATLYQTLIEQIDSLTVFDDCDSIIETSEGINLLKGALDTTAVRSLSYASKVSLNTLHMQAGERDDIVNAISRILRGKPEGDDLTRFSHYLPSKKKATAVKKEKNEWFLPDPMGELDNLDKETNPEQLDELQSYFSRHLPSKIDFRGRIIFISNIDEKDWDTAITSRTFHQNMNFSSEDMLTYIEKIKDTIPAENLTDEQKDEVIKYIRELHDAGQIHSRINFRFVQKCLDLRLCANWRKMVPYQ